jgi:hypothetical protein
VIDWGAFVTVAVASIVSASVLVTLYALGARLIANEGDFLPRTKRILGVGCFVLCAALVLYGIYLIVPALHGG